MGRLWSLKPPVPTRYYATNDPAVLSGRGESNPEVFDRPDFNSQYVVQTGPDGEIVRVYSIETNNPDIGRPIVSLTRWAHLPSNEEDLELLRRSVRKLGIGMTREVFEDANHAVKVALNASGRRANRTEVEVASRSRLVNPTIGHDPDFTWVRQPKLRLLTDKELADRLGLNKRFQTVMIHWTTGAHAQLPVGNPKWDEFRTALEEFREALPDIGDIERSTQWGVDSNGDLRLLDYGYRSLPAATEQPLSPRVLEWSEFVSPKQIRFEHADGTWHSIEQFMPEPAQLPAPPPRTSAQEQLRWWAAVLGISGAGRLRVLPTNA